jgi:gas vesicle protein
LAGGIIALLLTQDKGNEQRKKIDEKIKEGCEVTKEQIEYLLVYLKQKASDGISGLEEEIANLEEQLENFDDKIKDDK